MAYYPRPMDYIKVKQRVAALRKHGIPCDYWIITNNSQED